MKYLFYILSVSLLFESSMFCQNKYPIIEDVDIELISYGVHPNMFGGAYLYCSKNINDEEEKRFKVIFVAKFFDFSTDKIIDFNNISLVDTDNKIRYRPDGVEQGNSYVIDKPLDEYVNEDTFTKYSQDGLENFDFYVYPTTAVATKNKRKPKYRYRMMPGCFKKKKGVELFISFPAFKTRQDSGNFKIYWKQKMIGEFSLVNGKPI